ncbi:hypothetical protein [Enterococcus raffinosus]|uniref:hypothetical protein n=1 Tax=Enterococcus raffinosus TaxID=71452 RepID=UPI00209DF309|nr:hypothetical protein [Enterococcus raffinosus]
METKEVAYRAAMELAETLKKIDQGQIDQLIASIKQANRIFVSGAGRSLLMLKGLAMRLMHLFYMDESFEKGVGKVPNSFYNCLICFKKF